MEHSRRRVETERGCTVSAKATRAEACRRVKSERRAECVEPHTPTEGESPEEASEGAYRRPRRLRLGWSAARRGNSTRSALAPTLPREHIRYEICEFAACAFSLQK